MKITQTLVALMLAFQATNIQSSEISFDNLLGIWETEPYLSQLGVVVTQFYFKDNNECTISINFLNAKLNEIAEKGFYEFKEGELIIRKRNRDFFHTYTLIKGILTITEKNGDTYILKRKQSI